MSRTCLAGTRKHVGSELSAALVKQNRNPSQQLTFLRPPPGLNFSIKKMTRDEKTKIREYCSILNSLLELKAAVMNSPWHQELCFKGT